MLVKERIGTFETNSSSTHVLSIMTNEAEKILRLFSAPINLKGVPAYPIYMDEHTDFAFVPANKIEPYTNFSLINVYMTFESLEGPIFGDSIPIGALKKKSKDFTLASYAPVYEVNNKLIANIKWLEPSIGGDEFVEVEEYLKDKGDILFFAFFELVRLDGKNHAVKHTDRAGALVHTEGLNGAEVREIPLFDGIVLNVLSINSSSFILTRKLNELFGINAHEIFTRVTCE